MPENPIRPAVPAVPSHWRFPADPASVRRARQAVTDALPYGCHPRLGDDLGLLTSELVTNAIRHGTRPTDDQLIELVLWPADGHYWLAVSDPGPGVPMLTRAAPDATGGRGLLLVDALSAAWAVLPRPTRGKSVVAGVPLHSG
ncbi:ATP-binding protein [Streptomyces sp.]|uniref:ATP-binding protein n=1 Tax=Streptomyces sp. TaxID=1931 RepID=UPI002F3E64AC